MVNSEYYQLNIWQDSYPNQRDVAATSMSRPIKTPAIDNCVNTPPVVVIEGDCRQVLKTFVGQVDLIVTSPPYADARRKHYDSVPPNQFTEWFLTFHEPFFQALKPEGSFVLNIKDKVVNGVRHRYVWQTLQALSERGWYSIDDFVWHKTNSMPGRWPNRLRDAWETCFHLAKSKRPYFNPDAVSQPIGTWRNHRRLTQRDLVRNCSANGSGFSTRRANWYSKNTVFPTNVLNIHCANRNTGHPAAFPVELPNFFIRLLCPDSGLVIDPFAGSGTTGIAAWKTNRRCVLIDNQPRYCQLAINRLGQAGAEVIHNPSISEQKELSNS